MTLTQIWVGWDARGITWEAEPADVPQARKWLREYVQVHKDGEEDRLDATQARQ